MRFGTYRTFDQKVALFLHHIRNGVIVLRESRPYSLKVDLENYREHERMRRRGESSFFHEQDVYVKESPEEIERQIKLLEEIRKLVLDNKKSLLQQKEEKLSLLEKEEETIRETEALIDMQTQKEEQSMGEN